MDPGSMLTRSLLCNLDRQLNLPVFVSLQRSYRDPRHGRLVGEPGTRPSDGDGAKCAITAAGMANLLRGSSQGFLLTF